MRIFFIISIGFVAFCMNAQSDKQLFSEIDGLMKKQEKAWNAFNIDDFMRYYWKSDSLMLIGSKGITYGWQKTLDNYKKNYSTKEKMGVLTFENIHFEHLCDNMIEVIGKWQIERESGNIGGIYTLKWKKINGRWVIVSDHTS